VPGNNSRSHRYSSIIKAMIQSISGILEIKRPGLIVISVHGVGFRIIPSASLAASLPEEGSSVTILTHLHVRETELVLFGFSQSRELSLFERLTTVSGVGPKSALSILNVSQIDQFITAINEGRTELITRASGIGKKTAERIGLELKGKLDIISAPQTISLMESDLELEETLIGLGYSKNQARTALTKLDPTIKGFKNRLRAILKSGKQPTR